VNDTSDEYPARGGVAPDRLASALHLFDDGPAAAQHEQSAVERWERAGLLFDAKDYPPPPATRGRKHS